MRAGVLSFAARRSADTPTLSLLKVSISCSLGVDDWQQ